MSNDHLHSITVVQQKTLDDLPESTEFGAVGLDLLMNSTPETLSAFMKAMSPEDKAALLRAAMEME